MPETAPTVRALRLRITAQKGHFTRDESLLAQLDDHAAPAATAAVDRLLVRIETLTELFVEMAFTDPDENGAGESELAGLNSRLAVATNIVSAAVAAARLTAASGGARGVVFKEQTGLRPVVLAATATPPDMDDWIALAKVYQGASNMSLLALDEQRAYFFRWMDVELKLAILPKVVSTTTLDGCAALLRARFVELHPVFQRRLAWFELKKGKHQTISELVVALDRATVTAEIAAMELDDWRLFRFLHCCRGDDALYLELLKLVAPTFTTAVAAAAAFEAALKAREASGSATAPATAFALGMEVLAIGDESRCLHCGLGHGKDPCPAVDRQCF
jgi:hypothetical protein